MRSGLPAVSVAAAVVVPQATIYRWVRQDRIDRGELAGMWTIESGELRAARLWIVELEAELATVKRASELFAQGRVVCPKALCGIVEMLAGEGHGTKRVCRILAAPASAFLRWRSVPPSNRAIRRAWLAGAIQQVHAASRGTYGFRRVRAELADAYGQVVNKKLIRSIMVELGISGLPTRRRAKPNPIHRLTSEDLVNRDFRRAGPNQLWVTDITEHPTLRRHALLLRRPRVPTRDGSSAGRSTPAKPEDVPLVVELRDGGPGLMFRQAGA